MWRAGLQSVQGQVDMSTCSKLLPKKFYVFLDCGVLSVRLQVIRLTLKKPSQMAGLSDVDYRYGYT